MRGHTDWATFWIAVVFIFLGAAIVDLQWSASYLWQPNVPNLLASILLVGGVNSLRESLAVT